MSALDDYEKRFGLQPLTPEEILKRVDLAEACLGNPRVGDPRLHTERVVFWLGDRVQAMASAIGDRDGVTTCAWCWRAAGFTREAHGKLPRMTLDDAAAHSQVCDHNPLVRKIRELERQVEESKAHAARTIEHFDQERGRL